ncbi:MAG: peptide-methionine (S)-S-oxide reductase MsrA [Pseudomonadota bacterium]
MRIAWLLVCVAATPAAIAAEARATFAGGCFWCTEADFEKVDGVIKAVSGYTGGGVEQPSYTQVSSGATGHAEAVQITYDPAVVSYEHLLDVYWHSVDPYTANAQFCDHGSQYRTAIFVHDEVQRALAERSKVALARQYPDRPPIVTEIADAGRFWAAEDYHQDYYEKNPLRYNYYRWSCGRDQRLDELWGSGRLRK